VENLQISNMVQNHHLAKSISDASWSKFFELLSYKAAEAGRKVIKVSPYNTSQICSRCKRKVEKSLAERIHTCSLCGLIMDRDENAARNILWVGQTHQVITSEVALCVT
jgi:putative transposase